MRREERKILHLQNDGNNFTVNNIYEEPNLPKIEPAQSCFDAGKKLVNTKSYESDRAREKTLPIYHKILTALSTATQTMKLPQMMNVKK